jgi:phosphoserine aminotransferase
MKIHNFSAGPAILPREVIEQAAAAVLDFNNSGMSILEVSHRGADFEAVMAEAEQLVRELLGVSDEYAVLFLTGGASSQFFMAPMNLLKDDETAAYTDTGVWANKAIKEAKAFGKINVVASSKDSNYTFIPKDFEVPADAQYLHFTTNNTIYGTQWREWPKQNARLVCDMSSDFLSRPVPMDRFDMIYAGAQKNLGPAGVTLVIVKKELMSRAGRTIPCMLEYKTHAENGSMYNTPPVYPIFVSMLTMRWLKKNGGLEAMHQQNLEKAAILYDEIDRNPLFKGTCAVEDRSLMNVTFVMENPDLEKPFLKYIEENGVSGLKGHRSVGGFRASIYNAMPIESVEFLVGLMKNFNC